MSARRIAVLGATLAVFCGLALASPGRLDIVDGHNRYEVARSLVEHGDLVVRDAEVWFNVFPGRGGQSFSAYRLPQSLLGVLAILVSDATGVVSEGRRHFFFALTSAAAAAALVPLFEASFRDRAQSPRRALGWAVLGVLATPALYYGTSTFDDILGTVAVLASVVAAERGGARRATAYAALSGFALGIAFHCKQPLGIFALPALVALTRGERRFGAVVAFLAPVLALLVVYVAHDRFKFPPETLASHEPILATYAPAWFANPLVTLPALLLSGGAGAVFYAPASLLGVEGLRREVGARRAWGGAMLAAIGVFVCFISLMRIFKGDPAWGPRYLTPILVLLWLWAPEGWQVVGSRRGAPLLAVAVAVQLLAIAVDPHRLLVARGLPNAWTVGAPALLFHPDASHLLQRPGEILEILTDDSPPVAYSPARAPTGAPPMAQHIGSTPEDVERYVILDELRPWWAAYRHLPPDQRPVPIGATLAICAAGLSLGVGLAGAGGRSRS